MQYSFNERLTKRGKRWR